MAFFYMDTDGGSDASDGTTWALAKLTLEGLITVMAAGDTGFIQGLADDTTAVSRTFTSPGTIGNPCKFIGVVDGTTNTGTNVVVADLAVTLPKIECTGGASDVTFDGFATYINLHLSASDRMQVTSLTITTVVNGKLSTFDDLRVPNANIGGSKIRLVNSDFEALGTASSIINVDFEMLGGARISTGSASVVHSAGLTQGTKEFRGVDFSDLGTTTFIGGGGGSSNVLLVNCKTPVVFNFYGSTPATGSTMTVVASSDTTSVADTDSIQDYQYEDAHGTVDAEFTAVRTGGANDGASGAFSYAMTPRANSTLESSGATLKSPWMNVWVSGGSNTLTVYIANDSANTDYLEDEAWIEVYTPNSNDTAQHEQTFFPASERLLDSSTAVTDDTGSTWGAGANNHQKMSVTVTTGFEGWAYARVHLAKRQAVPDTLFLDPKIEVS